MNDALSIGETVDRFEQRFTHCTFVIVGLIYVAESAMSIRRNISEEPNICMHGGKHGSKQLEIETKAYLRMLWCRGKLSSLAASVLDDYVS